MKNFSLILLAALAAIAGGTLVAQSLQSNQKTGSGQQSSEVAQSANQSQDATGTSDAKKEDEMNLETATFGGGCFWCTEAVFQQLVGVDSVLPGYMGGHVDNPTYQQVCGGRTGHAEVIQIKFDPEKISFDDLLFVFFKTHDPTTLNRQGNDVGPQYRSAVFYHDDSQKASAEEIIKKIDESKLYAKPIVTEVTAAAKMYVAEDYHINYFNKNPDNAYCQAFIPGKIAKLKKLFGDKLKTQAQK